ncbi:MAG: hypothetical protein JOZ38_06350 [Candidatus Eremiobacteraeota bacterium]|nr:hypothetical protein [Candidatus Eremiobacteraeota bacterium]
MKGVPRPLVLLAASAGLAAICTMACSNHSSAATAGSRYDTRFATETAPPAIARRHVLTWAYWGQSGEDPTLGASWLAAHVDYIETNPTLATRFRSAGGKYAVVYTDPFRVIVARNEPFSDVPENGWFHTETGERVGRQFGGWGVQNLLNPAAPATVSAFAALTRSFTQRFPGVFTHVFVDDVSWDTLNVFYGANARGVEASDDAAYDRAVGELLQRSALPVFFNGLGNQDAHLHDVSGGTVFLNYAAGGVHEGCFFNVRGARTGDEWRFDENTLLYATSRGKDAVCLDNTSAASSVAARTYFLPSWWLTFDAAHSMAFENLPSPGNVKVFPEEALVPADPKQTANANVDELKTASGAYARQFGACYKDGALLGACAAVVNPSASATVEMPSWVHAYSKVLTLDANNSFDGGQARFSAGIPSELEPQHGVIVLRPH